ncbi:ATPase, F1/V1/A1 complex, alpha/beta subunit, Zinc knuckle CX2CX4HX4C [Artemisia annua]|uniref:ATPase, F1/V1/A1 complex, alpha/beta subunit, Zinc knuckle CX2CX4HX4C n=1 Tax=Artemisia annua TaxID=35608 RepID=A0A2U1P2A8_ARTAN|nr:ATPase, F1/V1/A1 complex, alpha/beta subunit, Zinc knuckle CX2CX4HX4C [Artemisia annua]
MDRITSSICEKAYGRANFSRVLVEVNAEKGLIEEVDVCYKSPGKTMKLKVEYPWKPPVCSNCKVFGHELEKCKHVVVNNVRQKLQEEIKDQKKDKDIVTDVSENAWQFVNGKSGRGNGMATGSNGHRMYVVESSNRGGFSGRGRGNMNGRGFGNCRFNRNDNKRYVPAEKNSTIKSNNVQNEGAGIEKTKVDPTGKSNDVSGIGEVSKSNDMGNNKSTIGMGMNVNGNKEDLVNTRNRFAALAREQESDQKVYLDVVKARIDAACTKGMYISLEERNSWSDDVKEYYKDQLQKLVKKLMWMVLG